MQDPKPEQPFNLTRWFAIVGLVGITTVSTLAAFWLSRFLSENMLRHEATLTMEYVQSLVVAEQGQQFFVTAGKDEPGNLTEDFYHLAAMPDVLRANVYNRNKLIIWSSDSGLIGRRFPENDELDEALIGRLVVHSGQVAPNKLDKAEHTRLVEEARYYVESYVPIWDAEQRQVIGVVEVYKEPKALFDAIRAGTRNIWLAAIAGAIILYAALFWLVRRADRLIRAQRDRLLETETLAVVGEMGSAVAHGIRNPLASIRSSAELVLESGGVGYEDAAEDIVAEVDRVENWVRDLLSYSRPVQSRGEAIDLRSLVGRILEEFGREMEKRSIARELQVPESLPCIRGDAALLTQVINSLLANAVEAMTGPGSVTVSGRVLEGARRVELAIRDTGPGIPEAQMKKLFKPFQTTKAKGLGVGLPLAKRIVERLGGKIAIRSTPGAGTTVLLEFPVSV